MVGASVDEVSRREVVADFVDFVAKMASAYGNDAADVVNDADKYPEGKPDDMPVDDYVVWAVKHGAAYTPASKTLAWTGKHGTYHRTNGPACERFGNGHVKEFWVNGHCTRPDGPALIDTNRVVWARNGKRIAIIHLNGTEKSPINVTYNKNIITIENHAYGEWRSSIYGMSFFDRSLKGTMVVSVFQGRPERLPKFPDDRSAVIDIDAIFPESTLPTDNA